MPHFSFSRLLAGFLAAGCLFTSAARAASPVPPEKDLAAYLLVYFKDQDHSIHFALSSDGYSFTDVNNGKPVISGRDIAEQKGIRDPYIVRGPDNAFYMAMTDLHIYAKREGLRPTDWERDRSKYGWGNNRGMVLMKSTNLIDWSHEVLRVDQAFPGLEDIGVAWAPEMIWDPAKNRMMIYFSMRFGNGPTQVYYSYLTPDFKKLETKPELLFEYAPDKAHSYIDADITKVGNEFQLFYATKDGRNGIKQEVSDKLTSDYRYLPNFVDPERVAVEAPTVWKRNGENKWVLMYDIYGLRPANFGFSETSDFKTFTNLGRFNEGVMKSTNFSSPKHGAVISLTQKEAQALAAHWKLSKF